jgi:hypothetical protein
MDSDSDAIPCRMAGCPIRRSPDLCLSAAPRGFSQLATSFVGTRRQGIHRMPAFLLLPCPRLCKRSADCSWLVAICSQLLACSRCFITRTNHSVGLIRLHNGVSRDDRLARSYQLPANRSPGTRRVISSVVKVQKPSLIQRRLPRQPPGQPCSISASPSVGQ